MKNIKALFWGWNIFQFYRGAVMTHVRIEPIPISRYKYFMSKCDALTDYANQPVGLIHQCVTLRHKVFVTWNRDGFNPHLGHDVSSLELKNIPPLQSNFGHPSIFFKGGGDRRYGQALYILESAYWNRGVVINFIVRNTSVFPSSKSGYEASLCFSKSVWGYETFWRFLGPNWWYKAFYRFFWKRGHETYSESHNKGTKHFQY